MTSTNPPTPSIGGAALLDEVEAFHRRFNILPKAGLEPEWTPRELRHSFVSLLSDHGIPLERIALLVGHSSQATTEAVYRKQLRPVITQGAEAMDEIFADDEGQCVGRRA
ncbi:tyrosine-type recombinase/integrase [Streptomyces sp. ISL-1]|uniref:tyrosine-type recombinase/integrase n=1 Tax=Streptomyces sp. ISL-1 TaxID=2817657 RepID=UPI002552FB6F|nr:tyrosine-type recombinase/integrase [Streptomyces sp. ISL-1]